MDKCNGLVPLLASLWDQSLATGVTAGKSLGPASLASLWDQSVATGVVAGKSVWCVCVKRCERRGERVRKLTLTYRQLQATFLSNPSHHPSGILEILGNTNP